MSTTFKVFVDAKASASATTIKPRTTATAKKPTASTSSKPSTSLKTKTKTVAAVHDENDKENINPLTGLAPSSSTATKKTKKASGTGLRPKPVRSKTLPALSGLSVADGNAKHSSASGAVKKGVAPKRKPFGSVSNLAIMLEEAENEAENSQGETAADRRARELTVLPLADISEAYAPSTKKPSESQQSTSTSSTLASQTQSETQETLVASPPSTPTKGNRGTKRNCEDEELYSSGGDSPSKRQRTKAPLPRNVPGCTITPLRFFPSSSPLASPTKASTAPSTPLTPLLDLLAFDI